MEFEGFPVTNNKPSETLKSQMSDPLSEGEDNQFGRSPGALPDNMPMVQNVSNSFNSKLGNSHKRLLLFGSITGEDVIGFQHPQGASIAKGSDHGKETWSEKMAERASEAFSASKYTK